MTARMHTIRKMHKNEDGAAMIVVVCVLMVVMLICLTMIVGAYQTMSSVNDGARDVSDYQQAMSFSEVIRKEITGEDIAFPAAAGTDFKSFILNFAGDTENFNDGENAIPGGPTRELFADQSAPNAPGERYGDVRLILKKKQYDATNCTMFVTVIIEDCGRAMSTVTAGYDISVDKDATPVTMDIAFRSYYDMWDGSSASPAPSGP